jgi:hypothetical protein
MEFKYSGINNVSLFDLYECSQTLPSKYLVCMPRSKVGVLSHKTSSFNASNVMEGLKLITTLMGFIRVSNYLLLINVILSWSLF